MQGMPGMQMPGMQAGQMPRMRGGATPANRAPLTINEREFLYRAIAKIDQSIAQSQQRLDTTKNDQQVADYLRRDIDRKKQDKARLVNELLQIPR